MAAPLQGLKVVELARILAGPWAGQVLADLGAEVVKVESPLEAMSDIKRHHLIFFVIMAGFVIGGGEAMAILGPEFVAAYTFDLAIYLDAVMVTYALSAVAMAKRSGGWFSQALTRFVRRTCPRSKRATRSASGPPKSANDDDPAPAFLAA